MEQELLLTQLRNEPSSTLSLLFEKNRASLRRVIMARMSLDLHGRVDPSDIVQETFAEAFSRLEDYLENPTVPFLKWLYLLAEQNTIAAYRQHVKAQKRSTNREQRVAGIDSFTANDLQRVAVCDGTGPQQKFERHERRIQLERAMSMLPIPSQAVVRMRFLEGKSLAEISEALQISVDAVSKRAMRSLVTLSDFAEQLGLNELY